MKTRLLSLVLVLVMIVGVLVACTPQQPNTTDDPCANGCAKIDTNPKDGICDNCKKAIPGQGTNPGDDDGGEEEEPVIDYPWNTTRLIFQMTDHSNGNELSSGCRRYLTGELDASDTNVEQTDADVVARNKKAEELTKVDVIYDYLPEGGKFGWSANIENISREVKNVTDSTPDMYCNFVYDMMACSLSACFANLQGKVRGSGAAAGKNYFEFTDPAYCYGEDETPDYSADVDVLFDKYVENVRDERGYMTEYMSSLTLHQKKMYLVASDYFIDLVRAFFVIPVNLALFDEVAQSNPEITGDRDGNGTVDIEDLCYMIIHDKDWDYEKLIEYGSVFAPEAGTTSTLKENRVAFAASVGGVAASGLMYTTSMVIIHKEPDPDNPGDYKYYYPVLTESNEDLFVYTDNLKTLFSSTGIVPVANSDTYGHGSNSFTAIRNRFASNNILFGDIMCLGGLSYEQYQKMKNEDGTGGFAVVPVPLYRQATGTGVDGKPYEDKYQTQIHNIGRIGAISVSRPANFPMCSAFLNYQSTHSTDILNTYYDMTLKYEIANGSASSIEMLDYIRDNVRSAFDKAYEDAIGIFSITVNENAVQDKWHEIIQDDKYQMTDMRTRYTALMEAKQSQLNDLVNSCYPELPE